MKKKCEFCGSELEISGFCPVCDPWMTQIKVPRTGAYFNSVYSYERAKVDMLWELVGSAVGGVLALAAVPVWAWKKLSSRP